MLKIENFEYNVFRPSLHYWGFFINYFELPKLGDVEFIFRLRKKENIILLTFLCFFFKLYFLQEKVFFKVNPRSSNLYLRIKVKGSNEKFFFFFFMLKYLNAYLYKNKFGFTGNFTTLINKKKKKGYAFVSTELFHMYIYQLFQYNFLYSNYYKSVMYNIHILLLNVYFAEKMFKITLNTKICYKTPSKFNYIFDKVNLYILKKV